MNEGVSIFVVQGLLELMHVRTTQRYAHLPDGTLLDAAEVAAKVMQRACAIAVGAMRPVGTVSPLL